MTPSSTRPTPPSEKVMPAATAMELKQGRKSRSFDGNFWMWPGTISQDFSNISHTYLTWAYWMLHQGSEYKREMSLQIMCEKKWMVVMINVRPATGRISKLDQAWWVTKKKKHNKKPTMKDLVADVSGTQKALDNDPCDLPLSMVMFVQYFTVVYEKCYLGTARHLKTWQPHILFCMASLRGSWRK